METGKPSSPDLLAKSFNNAVNKYKQMHEADDPQCRDGVEAAARSRDKGAGPCASHASGVDVGADGEKPQVSKANVMEEADLARSGESGIQGPFNENKGDEQEIISQGSKPRYHYQHHAVTAGRTTKKHHKESRTGTLARLQQEQAEADAEAAISTRMATEPTPTDAQRQAAEAAAMYQQQQQAAAAVAAAVAAATAAGMGTCMPNPYSYYPGGPPMPGQVPESMRQAPGAYMDPKVWQAVQAGFLPPPPIPPFFCGFGQQQQQMVPPMSPWQLQFFNAFHGALQGQNVLQQQQAAPTVQQSSYQPVTTHMHAPSAPQGVQPGAVLQHDAAQQGWPAAPAFPAASSMHSLAPGHSGRPPVPSIAQTCKQQLAHMAEVGLPTEAQLEAAARAKAAEYGDPDVAPLLMAWYYAGYYASKRPAQNGPG